MLECSKKIDQQPSTVEWTIAFQKRLAITRLHGQALRERVHEVDVRQRRRWLWRPRGSALQN